MPKRLIFFDTETEDVNGTGKQKMKLAVALYWEVDKKTGQESIRWLETTEQKVLYDWIVSKCRRNISLRVLSANIWFDLRVSGLLKQLKVTRWLCTGFFSKGHTFIASFSKDNHRLEFINMQNYFNYPVSKIGQSIGCLSSKLI